MYGHFERNSPSLAWIVLLDALFRGCEMSELV